MDLNKQATIGDVQRMIEDLRRSAENHFTNYDGWRLLADVQAQNSTEDVLETPEFEPHLFLKVLIYGNRSGGTVQALMRFNDDSNTSNYRWLDQFGFTPTGGSSGGTPTGLFVSPNTADQQFFSEVSLMQPYGGAALMQGHAVGYKAAGSDPNVRQMYGKWQIGDLIRKISLHNVSGAGSYRQGMRMVVFGFGGVHESNP